MLLSLLLFFERQWRWGGGSLNHRHGTLQKNVITIALSWELFIHVIELSYLNQTVNCLLWELQLRVSLVQLFKTGLFKKVWFSKSVV